MKSRGINKSRRWKESTGAIPFTAGGRQRRAEVIARLISTHVSKFELIVDIITSELRISGDCGRFA